MKPGSACWRLVGWVLVAMAYSRSSSDGSMSSSSTKGLGRHTAGSGGVEDLGAIRWVNAAVSRPGSASRQSAGTVIARQCDAIRNGTHTVVIGSPAARRSVSVSAAWLVPVTVWNSSTGGLRRRSARWGRCGR